jgi:hypothetical protein
MSDPVRMERAEARLLRDLHQLERKGWEWRAVHLQLSRLCPVHRRPHHLQIVTNSLDQVLHRHQGEVYRLGDDDVVLLVKGAPLEELRAAVQGLRHLFSGDPLLLDPDAGESRFCSWYDLETDLDALVQLAQERSAQPSTRREVEAESSLPLDPAAFARLDHGVARADLAPLIRSQPICALVPRASPQPVFCELFVSIAELVQSLAPGTNPLADRWLFQRLTLNLDQRLIAALVAEPDRFVAGPTSINLNVQTVFTQAFTELDLAVQARHGIKVLIELPLVDVMGDLGAFVFARDYLRERGYLVCVDGLHHLHLPLISRRRLGLDLVKIIWTADLLDTTDAKESEAIAQAVERSGAERIILCRCGSAEAIEWGQRIGIRLFQGRYVDSRLRAQRPDAVRAARASMRASAGA